MAGEGELPLGERTFLACPLDEGGLSGLDGARDGEESDGDERGEEHLGGW